jgi:hypothetical protein
MSLPAGLRGPKEIALLLPILALLAAVAIAGVYGWTHLITSGPAPQRDATSAQVATGATEPGRGAYAEGPLAAPAPSPASAEAAAAPSTAVPVPAQ